MSELRPCESCGRHVRATAVTCPFCARTLVKVAVATALATALLSAAACAGNPAPIAAMYGGPPVDLTPPDASAQASDPSASAADGGAPSDPTPPTTTTPDQPAPVVTSHPAPAAPMYGAPPPREPQ